jgi:hypothetical protein
VEIVKTISEHKNIKKTQPVARGYKRVEAIVRLEKDGALFTRHIDVKA